MQPTVAPRIIQTPQHAKVVEKISLRETYIFSIPTHHSIGHDLYFFFHRKYFILNDFHVVLQGFLTSTRFYEQKNYSDT